MGMSGADWVYLVWGASFLFIQIARIVFVMNKNQFLVEIQRAERAMRVGPRLSPLRYEPQASDQRAHVPEKVNWQREGF
jgi:hypothetical protein